MSRATRLDLTDSDHMGLTHAESDRAALSQLAHQDDQPGPHARFGWPLVIALLLMLLVLNAPAIFNALRHLFA